jgi:Mrp family chromosome partitioning ATPase
MERIRAAIEKARETRGEVINGTSGPALNGQANGKKANLSEVRGSNAAAWAALEEYKPHLNLMNQNRIVTFDQKDNAHVPFDMMRTRVLSACRQHNWKVVGITSPTPACGKTVTAINLAFSFARQKDNRTVLLDADLRRPMVAKNLGITTNHSMGRFLSGGHAVEDHFMAYGETLAIGTNNRRSLHSAEILQDAKATEAMNFLHKSLRPNIVIVDMPPMMAADDVMAFLPNIDAMLLIAAAGTTKIKEIDNCERDLSERTNVMGVVLNKCRYTQDSYNYEGYY